jgi:hypothetical protein
MTATPRFLASLFLLLLAAQILLYRDSFRTKPSQDDFITLHQIDRGEQQGALTFFKASDLSDYRPLQNLTFWLFGRGPRQHVLLSLRILHFLSFGFCAGVAFLWIYSLKLSRLGAIAAACVVFFHPIIAGPLAGLDNYSRFVVSALVWLGAWIVFRFGKQRPLLAIALVSACLVVGLGYMEYAVAMIPFAVLGMAWRVEQRRLFYASLMFASLAAVLAAYFLVRISGIVSTSAGTGYVSLAPLVWLKNSAIMTIAVLFFGNTVPVMLQASKTLLIWLAGNVGVVLLALSYGLWRVHRGATSESRLPVPLPALVITFGLTFFPMVLMTHVSEIYLTSIVVALALLVGVAAQGWTQAPRALQYLVMVFAAGQLFLATKAVHSKIAGINESGERAEAMMRNLLGQIPNDREARKVAIVFLEQGTKGYSVFSRPDHELVQTGYATEAFQWFRPDQPIHLDHLVVVKASNVDLSAYDEAFLWDSSAKQFTRIAPPILKP